jgi:glutamate--cysteine ligase
VSKANSSSSSPLASPVLAARLEWLRAGDHAAWVRRGLRGVEKESLRVTAQGKLSQLPHPKLLGAALTHPYITTDYSEALPELVTPPQRAAGKRCSFSASCTRSFSV